MNGKVIRLRDENNIFVLILFIFIIEGIGALSGFLGMTGETQYKQLIKPSFSPPSIVFPIVWIILYFLMAVALYIVWVKGKEGESVRKAFILFGIQLFLNFIWSIIFFRFNMYGLAFLDLLLLIVFVLLTTFEFYRIDKKAAFLMIPYIIWITFAGILNYAIWMLNS